MSAAAEADIGAKEADSRFGTGPTGRDVRIHGGSRLAALQGDQLEYVEVAVARSTKLYRHL
jgi:hypothetical protein